MVKKIKTEILKLNNDSKFYQFLTDEEDKEILCNSYYSKGVNEGIEQGINQGIEQGILKSRIDSARKMKKEHCSLELIKKITGLDISTIMQL